jgi:enoyl-CoA hydratase/carnithine racemase
MDLQFEHLTCERNGRRLDVTIDAPPMNVMTTELFAELDRLSIALSAAVEEPDSVHLVVFRSADPDFFIAHFDVEPLIAMSGRPARPPLADGDELGVFHAMCERYRTMPVISIAEIAGRVGGGGAELCASFDMRFGAQHTMVLNQMEVPLGILPGGTGTQRIPWLVGRGRAMEIVVGGVDIDAETAEAWGWLNRALPAVDLQHYVEHLAERIASFDPVAVRAAKASVLAAQPDPVPGLRAEANLFSEALHRPAAGAAMSTFLERGGQTREGERQLMHLTADLFVAADEESPAGTD